jgi:hypothetical protein
MYVEVKFLDYHDLNLLGDTVYPATGVPARRDVYSRFPG